MTLLRRVSGNNYLHGSYWAEGGSVGANAKAGTDRYSVAGDKKIYLFGDQGFSLNSAYTSSDGLTWAEQSGICPVHCGKVYGDGVFFNGAIYIFGGDEGFGNLVQRAFRGQVDGNGAITGFSEIGTNILPQAIRWHSGCVHNGAIYYSGGVTNTGDGTVRKVIKSNDGITWAELGTNVLPAGVLHYKHKMLSFQNKLWLIGSDDSTARKKVYNSDDGITWSYLGAVLPLDFRDNEAVVYDDVIVIMYASATYYSKNGIQWNYAGANLGNSAANVFKDKIIAFKGSAPNAKSYISQ